VHLTFYRKFEFLDRRFEMSLIDRSGIGIGVCMTDVVFTACGM
jgi:hypothetical protein